MDPTIPSLGFNPFDFGAGDSTQQIPPQQPDMYPGMPPAPTPPLPEQVAGFLGNKNVTPQEFLANPLAFLPKISSGPGGDLGSSLQPGGTPAPGVPLPTPRPAAADASQAVAQAQGKSQLLQALQGIKAPAAPVPQKVSTPSAPIPHAANATIKGGNLIALLSALGGQVPTTKVPLSLGSVIGGR